jgi:hypothetical protein
MNGGKAVWLSLTTKPGFAGGGVWVIRRAAGAAEVISRCLCATVAEALRGITAAGCTNAKTAASTMPIMPIHATQMTNGPVNAPISFPSTNGSLQQKFGADSRV